jgi:hypothetical protein
VGAAEMTEQMPPEREDLVDVFYIPFVRHCAAGGASVPRFALMR